jgi:hypothetical protein
MDIAPAANPATPATNTASFDAEAAATPIMRLAVETMASSDPRTAARNHPARPLRCTSTWLAVLLFVLLVNGFTVIFYQIIGCGGGG